MAAIAGHRLTLEHMEKCSNAFFSETSANQSILLALAAIFNIRLERKTVTL
jgi:hypothetical protein